ncbi:hypothetical protein [Streptomyces yaizuensis]|uniref:HEAT repeat domain-containing protein n=1 Tax=Streptomyces yaizuensis TaxID=2989713 RepID=A0ABQ5NXA6_9ACTN|nr:hypothetical protein [Streptomyces sp. YSPA8]GLF94990.1 HEAT repeat domain-containing protein [Streptomyces sp. YSPA8]
MRPLLPLLTPCLLPAGDRLTRCRAVAAAIEAGDPARWERLDSSLHWSSRGHGKGGRLHWAANERWLGIADGTGGPGSVADGFPSVPELAIGLGHHGERVLRAALPAASGRPELLPLLLMRCAHGAPAVRNEARRLLEAELSSPVAELPELLPLALLLSTHRHGRWGWRLLRRLLGAAAADETARRACADPHDGLRRAAVTHALSRRLLTGEQLAAVIEREPHPYIRELAVAGGLQDGLLASELLVRLVSRDREPRIRALVWRTGVRDGLFAPEHLARLAAGARDRTVRGVCTDMVLRAVRTGHPERFGLMDVLLGAVYGATRAAAVAVLPELGRGAELEAHLGDSAPVVQETAYRALVTAGRDPRALLRARCADPAGVPSYLLAFLVRHAEAGDAALFRSVLAGPGGSRVRTVALAGLHRLGRVPREELLRLLGDPHPGVVDQVLRWLLPCAEDLPESRIAALLAPANPRHVRRAGVWLAEWYERQGRIRLLTPYAGDPDPWIGGRARWAARGW